MKKKLFAYLSTGTLIIGAALGGYALLNSFILTSKIPAGACPVTNYRPLIYTSIALLLISFVFSIIEQSYKKKTKPAEIEINDETEDDNQQ